MASMFMNNGVPVIHNKYKSIYNPLVVLHLFGIAKNYDVIHSHLFPTQYYTAVLKLLFLFTNKKIKFVTTEHCTTNKRRRPLFKLIEKLVYSSYNKIIGVSDAATQNLKKWIDISDNKVVTIHNGIDIRSILSASSYSKATFGIPEEQFVLCMTARFFEQKDHSSLIKAMQFLPDNIVLLLIGSGNKFEESIKLCETLKLQNRIKFLGRRRDVYSIIKLADICILSTHYEGFPVSILEYFCAGKPVIATNVDGVNEMLDDSSLLCNPNDPHDLACKILNLSMDNNKMNKESERNRMIIEKYSLENMTENYLQIYECLFEQLK